MASKLVQMQARFQQKQMQEKEEKLLRLYESQQQRTIERVSRGSAGSNTSVTSMTSINSTQGGKVRQMFDERRQKAGIDRSYPLEPLRNTKINGKSNTERPRNDNISNKTVVKTTLQRSVTHVKNGKPLINKREVIRNVYNNNNGDETYEEDFYEDDNVDAISLNRTYKHRDLEAMMNEHHINSNIDDEEFPDVNIDVFDEPIVKARLSNVGGKRPSENIIKKNAEEKIYMKSDTSPKAITPVKKENKPFAKKTLTRVATSPTSNSSTTAVINRVPAISSPSRILHKSPPRTMHSLSSNTKGQKENKKSSSEPRTPSTVRPSSKQTTRGPSSAVKRDDLEGCRYCSRRFAADRLTVHEEICARTAKKKRKTYDATKHRVEGTELEPYTKKPGRSIAQKSTKQPPAKKTDWRRKHEEFISAIRAAKMAQVHVAKGGRLSDLPPPPPSYNPDYVQCPHCGRRFNESAAERHIPKCASYNFNKPKQQSRPGGGRNSTNKTR